MKSSSRIAKRFRRWQARRRRPWVKGERVRVPAPGRRPISDLETKA